MAIILSLLTPLLTGLLLLGVWQGGSFLHRYERWFYIITSVAMMPLVGVSILLQTGAIATLDPVVYALFFQGQLGFAFFILVMFAGALRPKSKTQIMLLKVRRELAVLGFIVLVPHAVLLVIRALRALNPTGTLAFFIIVPLVITSFPVVRRKMTPATWRGFHYWAYIVYGLIYAHIASITVIVQWNDGTAYGDLAWLRFFIYTGIFIIYLTLKQKYHARKKNAPV